MDLILVDPGTVIGPNYCSKPVCLECLQLLDGTSVRFITRWSFIFVFMHFPSFQDCLRSVPLSHVFVKMSRISHPAHEGRMRNFGTMSGLAKGTKTERIFRREQCLLCDNAPENAPAAEEQQRQLGEDQPVDGPWKAAKAQLKRMGLVPKKYCRLLSKST